MGKLILQTQISIDGYVAAEDGGTDWMVWNWGPEWTWDEELRNYHNELSASIDVILLSRKMAEEGFISHWAKVAAQTENPQSEFAQQINKKHKIVFTSTLKESIWENTTLATGELTEEVEKVKGKTTGNIIIYGGATFVMNLISADLIDEFHFITNPVILGKGLPIFTKLNKKLNLSLINSTNHTDGIVVSKYARNL